MITSKLTSKARTTIPRPVREALRLRPGDAVADVIEGPGGVVMVREPSEENPFATFTEWGGDEHRKAHAEL